MAPTSEPASGSVSANAAMALPLPTSRQITLLQLLGTGERDRAAAEALHHESEIGQTGMARQRFPRDHQIARLQRVVGAAIARRHALAEPAGSAER